MKYYPQGRNEINKSLIEFEPGLDDDLIAIFGSVGPFTVDEIIIFLLEFLRDNARFPP